LYVKELHAGDILLLDPGEPKEFYVIADGLLTATTSGQGEAELKVHCGRRGSVR
jgi:hypothetical protein